LYWERKIIQFIKR